MSSREVLWAQSYVRSLRDVLTLQNEVARHIAEQVGIALTPEERRRLTTAPPVSPKAYEQVLLGRYHEDKGTEEELRKALTYFERAIEWDPEGALGYAGLADAYTGLSGFYADPRDVIAKARAAAEAALTLDESLATAHAALGYIKLVYDWDGPSAERLLLRALDLNPTLARARLHYAAYLSTQARHAEAVNEIQRAAALDPLSLHTHTFGTLFLQFARHYDEAVALAGKALDLQPDAPFALAFRGMAFVQQNRLEDALADLSEPPI